MTKHLNFGIAEQLAATRLIELALAEDLLPAVPNVTSAPSLAELFSVTTVDTVLDDFSEPLNDLERDLTCSALVDPQDVATIDVVVRREGVLAGGPIGELIFDRLSAEVVWTPLLPDGALVQPGAVVARVTGPLRALLIGERTTLNFLMHLSGVATQTRRFVDAVRGTQAVILDTRKTLPGWRALEKYAVRCGGGTNHRMGLHDGVLIKDNHVAAWTRGNPMERDATQTLTDHDGSSQPTGPTNPCGRSLADAVRAARERTPANVPIEVEVDTLDQLRDVLFAKPDIVLLDNMVPELLRAAVTLRDTSAPSTRLEASGGITLANVREIAETGVDRISVGALTHSAPALDIGFDWHPQS